MSDAPERIWAHPRITAGWNDAIAGTRETCCGTEYTRTDLIAALIAEAEQRGREAEREECARVADGYHQESLAWAKTVRGLSEHIDETDSSRIAAAIRTRGPA